jgi:uncharacterized protein
MVNPDEYYYAIGGGLIIALAASLNLLIKGRITGISGILFGTITLNGFFWKINFLIGLLLSYSYFYCFIKRGFFETPEVFLQDLSLAGFFVAGLLVGFGTKLGNGCTSGHGVSGLPRLSIRSIVACGTFLTFGIGFATLKGNFPFLSNPEFISVTKDVGSDTFHYAFFGVLNFFGLLAPIWIILKKKFELVHDYVVSLSTGIIFGIGLILSGMVKRSKIINFLNVTSNDWDPSLLFVLCSAVGLNLILFNIIIRVKKTPLRAEKFELPTKTKIDIPLVLGSAIFGIGWGIGGLCPGPLIVNVLVYIPHTLAFLSTCIIGQILAKYTEKYFFSSVPIVPIVKTELTP